MSSSMTPLSSPCPGMNNARFVDWLRQRLQEDRRRLSLELELQHKALVAEVVDSWTADSPQITRDEARLVVEAADTLMPGSSQIAADEPHANRSARFGEDAAPALLPRTDEAHDQDTSPTQLPERDVTSATPPWRDESEKTIESSPTDYLHLSKPNFAKLSPTASSRPARPAPLKKTVKRSGSNPGLLSWSVATPGPRLKQHMKHHMKKQLRVERVSEISESRLRRGKRPVAGSFEFELASSFLILVGMVVNCLEMQYDGYHNGHKLGISDYVGETYLTFKSHRNALNLANWICSIIFTLEFFVRLYDYKRSAIQKPFLWLDFVVISCAWLQIAEVMNINPLILRVFRLVRILRLAKLLRVMVAFQTLFLLIRSIAASMTVLLWTVVVLGSVQLAGGMFANQMLRAYIEDDSAPKEDRREIFQYFGTFALTMFTMFEITDANWVVSCRLLMRNVSKWWGLFYVLYRCFLFFSLGKIIAAVFISETNRINDNDIELVSMKKRARTVEYEMKMWKLFDHFNVEPGMTLARNDFKEMFQSKDARVCRELFAIDADALDSTFDLLENEDGHIPVEVFLKALPKLKNPAASADIWKTQKMIADFCKIHKKHHDVVKKSLVKRLSSGANDDALGKGEGSARSLGYVGEEVAASSDEQQARLTL